MDPDMIVYLILTIKLCSTILAFEHEVECSVFMGNLLFPAHRFHVTWLLIIGLFMSHCVVDCLGGELPGTLIFAILTIAKGQIYLFIDLLSLRLFKGYHRFPQHMLRHQ